MRKFALAGLAVVLSVGLTVAAEVVFLGYNKEKKELKVKDSNDKEVTYTVTEDTKFSRKGKDGEKDIPNDKGVEALEKMNDSDRTKGKAKLDVEVDGKKVKSIKMMGGGGKKKDKN